MTFGPFKCPDCGIWWAGFEHRCLNSTINIPFAPSEPWQAGGYCTTCGKYYYNEPHYCPGPDNKGSTTVIWKVQQPPAISY